MSHTWKAEVEEHSPLTTAAQPVLSKLSYKIKCWDVKNFFELEQTIWYIRIGRGSPIALL